MDDKELGVRISGLEKRIDDQKQFLGLISGVAALLISVLSIVFAWNLSGERESLRYFKSELKEEVRIELKKVSRKPLMTILTLDGQPLSGRTINATYSEYEGFKNISAPIIFKNIGKSSSGDISFKAYTMQGIVMEKLSTDEKKYSYEATYFPGKSGIDTMPGGGFSSNYIHLLVSDTGEKDTIPRSMQVVAGQTAQEFNMRKKRKGAYWEDRYRKNSRNIENVKQT